MACKIKSNLHTFTPPTEADVNVLVEEAGEVEDVFLLRPFALLLVVAGGTSAAMAPSTTTSVASAASRGASEVAALRHDGGWEGGCLGERCL